jgi:hypothetical protein
METMENSISALRCEVERLQAIVAIQNLMGTYEVIHNQSDVQKSWKLFAQHTPDTWAEVSNWGRVEAIEQIRKFWEAQDFSKAGMPVGAMFSHHLTTPIIQVAGDCKTTKATWFSPGHETKPRDGKLTALWCWGKYAIDFVKEDGAWKIWHFKWFRTFITPYDVSWVDRPMEPEMARFSPDGDFGYKPTSYHRPYFPDQVQESIPPAPRPYDAWTEAETEWPFKPTTMSE